MAKTAAERQRDRRAKLKEAGKYYQYKQKASQLKTILRKKKLRKKSRYAKKKMKITMQIGGSSRKKKHSLLLLHIKHLETSNP